ncbi:hypothetical protein JIN77_06310 [Verrucomicrobiaceae bacterium R5-34]|uniref:Uncharacterized protein n=1 Tax=Oceaniferula flava TaxID=2800421 RepID=A0AAE2SDN8_9BACT|nr:hypothetical protein [Oceaniferula flavus]MBK1830329.1 hypothetical protein [Verrucomicrobiaceae bacterium R5-34]MBK1854421.1 hypothetical protein [Oceaniferula flavus]MBM1135727.1 hypothetical protein [Oceaniferula flavus]
MFFLSKRRQRRDREAGLIFRWRGAKKHHAGKLVALMITVGFFAFSMYAIRVSGVEAPLASKRTASVFMINEDDPNCLNLLAQVEERSPFPRRWDPAFDEETMSRIQQGTQQLAGRAWSYEPELAPLPTIESDDRLPSIVEPNASLLGNLVQSWEVAPREGAHAEQGELFVRAKITADASIQKRLPTTSPALPQELVAEEWFGQSFRFLMGIDADGVVRGCVALSAETLEAVKPSDKQKLLAAWLRVQRFLPDDSKSPATIGVLELEIEALQE